MSPVNHVDFHGLFEVATESVMTSAGRLRLAFPAGTHPLSSVAETFLEQCERYQTMYDRTPTLFAEEIAIVGIITLFHCVQLLDTLSLAMVSDRQGDPGLQRSMATLLIAIERWVPEARQGYRSDELTPAQLDELILLAGAHAEVDALLARPDDPLIPQQLSALLLRLSRIVTPVETPA